jgi:isopenicillin N synthase-like dioxygenase
MKKVCITIIKHMEKALKVEPNEMLELFDDITQSMRMNLYPPCPQPENVIGLNPHSDAAALTILLQANEIEGLQIRKDGQWISIKPLADAFVINVGDILEVIICYKICFISSYFITFLSVLLVYVNQN